MHHTHYYYAPAVFPIHRYVMLCTSPPPLLTRTSPVLSKSLRAPTKRQLHEVCRCGITYYHRLHSFFFIRVMSYKILA